MKIEVNINKFYTELIDNAKRYCAWCLHLVRWFSLFNRLDRDFTDYRSKHQ
jgi:hypothetical protein